MGDGQNGSKWVALLWVERHGSGVDDPCRGCSETTRAFRLPSGEPGPAPRRAPLARHQREIPPEPVPVVAPSEAIAALAVAVPRVPAPQVRGAPPQVQPGHALLQEVPDAVHLRLQHGPHQGQLPRVDALQPPRRPHALYGVRVPLRAAHPPRIPRARHRRHGRPLLRAIPRGLVGAPRGLPRCQPRAAPPRQRAQLCELVQGQKVRNDDPTGVRSESLPSYAYIHLEHDYQRPDQLFFCDDDQTVLGKVNWLILRSDLYFASGLYLMPQFDDELPWMFPAQDTVLHHIRRYLFHPSNKVWGLIMRYYTSYMANFDEKIGLQITSFAWNLVPSEEYFKQIAACTSQEKILPEVDPNAASNAHEAAATKSKAVSGLRNEGVGMRWRAASLASASLAPGLKKQGEEEIWG